MNFFFGSGINRNGVYAISDSCCGFDIKMKLCSTVLIIDELNYNQLGHKN